VKVRVWPFAIFEVAMSARATFPVPLKAGRVAVPSAKRNVAGRSTLTTVRVSGLATFTVTVSVAVFPMAGTNARCAPTETQLANSLPEWFIDGDSVHDESLEATRWGGLAGGCLRFADGDSMSGEEDVTGAGAIRLV
jgi:hypothetical protein